VIEQVFVLMLENRSFDHLFAFSGIPAVLQPSPSFGLVSGAPDRLTSDPPHEFESVREQINDGAMTGFTGDGLTGFDPSAISTLINFAQNGLFFDNWFSSMPGPTWPNRLFAHAGSSAQLQPDLQANDAASYSFNKPNYAALSNFAHGNSQHPLGAVSAGEALIAYVHDAIFQSGLGPASALLVTWDEHGGFFDHVPPPPAIPPGDAPLNYERAANPGDCAFDSYAVRVPAMLVSPWLPVGLGSVVFPNQVFDHASIISSVRDTFGLGDPLTQRDAAAPTWSSALVSTPRIVNPLATPRSAVPKMNAARPTSPSYPGPPSIGASSWASLTSQSTLTGTWPSALARHR
jgi:phospholipase C